MENKVFAMVPGPQAAVVIMWVLVAVCFALACVTVSLALTMQSVKFEVEPDGLRIHAALYGRYIPWSSVAWDRARLVDRRSEKDLRPTLRTNGIGLPGYLAGWFRLRSGEKALLFLSGKGEAVYLPTTEGFAVMLSAREPRELYGAILSARR